jgi:hypothetical protein
MPLRRPDAFEPSEQDVEYALDVVRRTMPKMLGRLAR